MRAPHVLLCLATALYIAVSCSPPDFKFDKPRVGTCTDQILNGAETAEDCGGGECSKCQVGEACIEARDCVNGACVDRICQNLSCTDSVQNGKETYIDCGGPECQRCRFGQHCLEKTDCSSNSCVEEKCVTTGCDDGVFDPMAGESDQDCGGGTCAPCRNGKKCMQSGDCIDGNCPDGICRPQHCGNAQLDPLEEAMDCGGVCPPCKPVDPCADGALNEGETGTDCGGETECMRCPNDEGCVTASDCLSGYCDEATLKCQDNPCPDASDPCPSGEGGAGGAPNMGAAGDGGAPTAEGGAPGEAGSPAETGGTGGTSGEGGAGATPTGGSPPGGSGGTLGGGGSGGTTGGTTGGTVMTGPLSGCPTGCARLRVPLTEPANKANFVITLPNTLDFSTAVITYRLYVEAGSGGEVKGYVQHSGSPDFLQMFQATATPIASIRGWHDLVYDVGAEETTTFSKNNVGRVGIQITGANGTSFTNPTIVSIDSITIMGAAAGPFNFDSSGTVQTSASSTGPANVIFFNNGDAPSPTSGISVSWLDP